MMFIVFYKLQPSYVMMVIITSITVLYYDGNVLLPLPFIIKKVVALARVLLYIEKI